MSAVTKAAPGEPVGRMRGLVDAMVSEFRGRFGKEVHVSRHFGVFDEKEIDRLGPKSPAILVSTLGGAITAPRASTALASVQIGVFILTQGMVSPNGQPVDADAVASEFAELVMAIGHANCFGGATGVSAASSIGFSNDSNAKTDENDHSLWLVLFDFPVQMRPRDSESPAPFPGYRRLEGDPAKLVPFEGTNVEFVKPDGESRNPTAIAVATVEGAEDDG